MVLKLEAMSLLSPASLFVELSANPCLNKLQLRVLLYSKTTQKKKF